jgi:DNA invertase Pin-like site-specific DNA recombinase
VLIVAKLDRAFRNAADALVTAERLKARRVDLIVADMGSEPVTQNGVSRMFFGMLALVAEFERERIKERSAEGRAAKRRSGGHIGGSAPFGFRKVGTGRAARLESDQAQQAALSDMRTLAAKGLASRAIAAAVQERHGLAVSHVTVRPHWRGRRPDDAQTDDLKGGPGVLTHRTGPDRDHGSEP